jgi:allantoate deiminase
VHALLRAEMKALGMTVRTDSAGNLRGMYAGASERVLLLGSHIDTVPDAGAYDGVLGVALPIVLLRMLGGRRLSFAVEVIAFSEEEGVRFALPFIGSRALVGTLDAAMLARTDADGVSVAEALREFGLDPDATADAVMTPGTFAFVEVHIEQGPVLESLGLPLGVVSSIIGQTRLGVTFRGEANHAGTTPMRFRKDALAAAAAWIAAVEAAPHGDARLLATVGSIQALPGAANVIPGAVTCSLDVRHPSDDARLLAVSSLKRRAEECAQARGVTVEFVDRGGQASVPMDARLMETLAACAEGAHRMASGAGHDAMVLAPHVPTAMLFLRTPRGLSHHPEEAVRVEDVAVALEVCLGLLDSLEENKAVSRADSEGQL